MEARGNASSERLDELTPPDAPETTDSSGDSGFVNRGISRVQKAFGWQTPIDIVRDLMMVYEEPIVLDGPDELAYFGNRLYRIIAGIVALIGIGLITQPQVQLALLAVVFGVIVSLVLGAFKDHYTRYVITTDRVMYITGVIKREHMWIPYSKVTDLSFGQGLADRAMGVARVKIESANEASPFRELINLSHPKLFMHALSTMVNIRQAPMRSGQRGFGFMNAPAPKKMEILDTLLDRIEEAGLQAYTSRIEVKKAVFDDWDPTEDDEEEAANAAALRDGNAGGRGPSFRDRLRDRFSSPEPDLDDDASHGDDSPTDPTDGGDGPPTASEGHWG